MLATAHLVHRLAQQFGNVEAIMHHVGLRQHLPAGRGVSGAQVHGHRRPRRLGQRLQQTGGREGVATSDGFEHPRCLRFQVHQHRHVVLPAAEALFIHPQMPHALHPAPLQAPRHRRGGGGE